jgi:hypothetical protein
MNEYIRLYVSTYTCLLLTRKRNKPVISCQIWKPWSEHSQPYCRATGIAGRGACIGKASNHQGYHIVNWGSWTGCWFSSTHRSSSPVGLPTIRRPACTQIHGERTFNGDCISIDFPALDLSFYPIHPLRTPSPVSLPGAFSPMLDGIGEIGGHVMCVCMWATHHPTIEPQTIHVYTGYLQGKQPRWSPTSDIPIAATWSFHSKAPTPISLTYAPHFPPHSSCAC